MPPNNESKLINVKPDLVTVTLVAIPPERYQRFIEGRKEAHDGRQ